VALGRWLASDARYQAEAVIPELAGIFQAMDRPHRAMRKSAAEIRDVFIQADPSLPALMIELRSELGQWAKDLREGQTGEEGTFRLVSRSPIGKWLAGPNAKVAYRNGSPALKDAIDQLRTADENLYDSAKKVNQAYLQASPELTQALGKVLDEQAQWAAQIRAAIQASAKRLPVPVDPNQSPYAAFLRSAQYKQLTADRPGVKQALDEAKGPLERMYNVAATIDQSLAGGDVAGAQRMFEQRLDPTLEQFRQPLQRAAATDVNRDAARAAAVRIFDTDTVPLLRQTLTAMSNVRAAAEKDLAALAEAKRIYNTQTLPNFTALLGLLREAREVIRYAPMKDLTRTAKPRTPAAPGAASPPERDMEY